MKNILKYVIILMFTFIGTACKGERDYTMKENILIVISEEFHRDSLSAYTLQFNNTVPSGFGAQTNSIRLIFNSNAFEVNDKIKLVKMDE